MSLWGVIPAQAGIQNERAMGMAWIPACAGMTRRGVSDHD